MPSASFSMKVAPTNAWNRLVGGIIPLAKHLSVTAEASLGTRKPFTIMPGVRF